MHKGEKGLPRRICVAVPSFLRLFCLCGSNYMKTSITAGFLEKLHNAAALFSPGLRSGRRGIFRFPAAPVQAKTVSKPGLPKGETPREQI
jgi:hypothetical protein